MKTALAYPPDGEFELLLASAAQAKNVPSGKTEVNDVRKVSAFQRPKICTKREIQTDSKILDSNIS